jgi:hypothetical protein
MLTWARIENLKRKVLELKNRVIRVDDFFYLFKPCKNSAFVSITEPDKLSQGATIYWFAA